MFNDNPSRSPMWEVVLPEGVEVAVKVGVGDGPVVGVGEGPTVGVGVAVGASGSGP